MSVTDRWAAFLRSRVDARTGRANLAAMQRGLLPPGWVYGLNDQRQAEFDEQRHILLERSKYLFREPVTGPDGIAVAIFYSGGSSECQLPLLVPYVRWPGAPPNRLAALAGLYFRVVKRISPPLRFRYIVQAHAMSGPPAESATGRQAVAPVIRDTMTYRWSGERRRAEVYGARAAALL